MTAIVVDGGAAEQCGCRPPGLNTIMRRLAGLARHSTTRSTRSRRRDWSELPAELLDAIMNRFTKLTDVVHFQAVCKPWRRAVLDHQDQNPPKFRQSLPWLTWYSPYGRCQRVMDVTERNYRMDCGRVSHRRHLLDTQSHAGSALGWLLCSGHPPPLCSILYLFNPFTGIQIPLPSLDVNAAFHTLRFAMSAEPTAAEGCVVMVSYRGCRGTCLAFCKLGSGDDDQRRRWKLIRPGVEELNRWAVDDIVFWRDRFHAINWDRSVMTCCCDFVRRRDREAADDDVVISWDLLVADPAGSGEPYVYHLAASPEGELTLVARGHRQGRLCFRVYKIDEDEKIWNEVDSIGDYALFVDHYRAIYVPIRDHPECDRNSVYYMQGIFDLGSKDIKPSQFAWNFPFDYSTWILPTNSFAWILPSNY